MYKHLELSIVRKLMVAVVIAVSVLSVTLLEAPIHPAYALGPGRVCIFLAPSGAIGFGHIGWAFRVDQQDDWIYGATENPSGQQQVLPGAYNGAWIRESSWNTMVVTFASDLPNIGNAQYPYYHKAHYYTEFRCKDTSTSAVGSAYQTAQNIQNQGYTLDTNDCLTDAINVLTAYDGSLYLSSDVSSNGSIGLDPFGYGNGINTSDLANATSAEVPISWFSNGLDNAGFDPPTPLVIENDSQTITPAANPTPSSGNTSQSSSSTSSDDSSQGSSSSSFCIFGICF